MVKGHQAPWGASLAALFLILVLQQAACKSHSAAPASAPTSANAPSSHQSLSHKRSSAKLAHHGAAPAPAPAWAAHSVNAISEIETMSDKQLHDIFADGTAEIPGAEAKDVYQFCKGRTVINSWTQGGYPSGVWPQGKENPLNNVYGKGWFGKIIVTNDTGSTRVWNLLFSNHTVELNTQSYIQNPGLDPDGKPSMIIDYSGTEDVWARVFKDEIRKVGPNIWLGRVYVINPVEALAMTPRNPMEAAAMRLSQIQMNTTLMNTFTALGIEGPDAQPYALRAGEPFPLLYFVLDCQNSKVPALHYTAGAKFQEAMGAMLSYNAFGDTLPALNHSTADNGAVDNPVAIGESDGSFPELRLYSQKLSEMGAIGTIPVAPALPVEANILEDPRSVIEGRRTANILAPANETVLRTPMQAALTDVYQRYRSQAIEVGKAISTVVSDRLQAVTQALSGPQAEAAHIARTVSQSEGAIAQQTGIASMGNAFQAALAPTISAVQDAAISEQHSFTELNHALGTGRQQAISAARQGLAPVAAVAETLVSPARQAAMSASQAAAVARYNVDAAGVVALGPAVAAADAIVHPITAAATSALAPAASMAMGTVDAMSRAEVETASQMATRAMTPVSSVIAGVTRGITSGPLTGALAPAIGVVAVTAQQVVQPFATNVANRVLPGLPGQGVLPAAVQPRRNLLQLDDLMTADDEEPTMDLPAAGVLPRINVHSGAEATEDAPTTRAPATTPAAHDPVAEAVRNFFGGAQIIGPGSAARSASSSTPTRQSSSSTPARHVSTPSPHSLSSLVESVVAEDSDPNHPADPLASAAMQMAEPLTLLETRDDHPLGMNFQSTGRRSGLPSLPNFAMPDLPGLPTINMVPARASASTEADHDGPPGGGELDVLLGIDDPFGLDEVEAETPVASIATRAARTPAPAPVAEPKTSPATAPATTGAASRQAARETQPITLPFEPPRLPRMGALPNPLEVLGRPLGAAASATRGASATRRNATHAATTHAAQIGQVAASAPRAAATEAAETAVKPAQPVVAPSTASNPSTRLAALQAAASSQPSTESATTATTPEARLTALQNAAMHAAPKEATVAGSAATPEDRLARLQQAAAARTELTGATSGKAQEASTPIDAHAPDLLQQIQHALSRGSGNPEIQERIVKALQAGEARRQAAGTTAAAQSSKAGDPASTLAKLEKAAVGPLSNAFAQTTSVPKATAAVSTPAMHLPKVMDTPTMMQQLKTQALQGHEMPKQPAAVASAMGPRAEIPIPVTKDTKSMNEQMMAQALGGQDMAKKMAEEATAPAPGSTSVSTMLAEMKNHALAGHKAEADAFARLEKLHSEASSLETQAQAASTAERLQEAAQRLAPIPAPVTGSSFLAKGLAQTEAAAAPAPSNAAPMDDRLAEIQKLASVGMTSSLHPMASAPVAQPLAVAMPAEPTPVQPALVHPITSAVAAGPITSEQLPAQPLTASISPSASAPQPAPVEADRLAKMQRLQAVADVGIAPAMARAQEIGQAYDDAPVFAPEAAPAAAPASEALPVEPLTASISPSASAPEPAPIQAGKAAKLQRLQAVADAGVAPAMALAQEMSQAYDDAPIFAPAAAPAASEGVAEQELQQLQAGADAGVAPAMALAQEMSQAYDDAPIFAPAAAPTASEGVAEPEMETQAPAEAPAEAGEVEAVVAVEPEETLPASISEDVPAAETETPVTQAPSGMAIIPQASALPASTLPAPAPAPSAASAVARTPASSAASALAPKAVPTYVAASAPVQAASALPAPSVETVIEETTETISPLAEQWASVESITEEAPETEPMAPTTTAVVGTGSPAGRPSIARAVDSAALDGVRTSMLAQRPYVRTRALLQEDFPGSDAQADAQAAALAGLVQESTGPAAEAASAVYSADDHWAQQVIAAVNSSVAEESQLDA